MVEYLFSISFSRERCEKREKERERDEHQIALDLFD